MKSSKSIIFLIALSISTIFVVSAFIVHTTTAAARVRALTPMGSVTPVKRVDVLVVRNPRDSAARQSQTDAEGSFTFGDLTPGMYSVSLQCNAICQSTNDLSVGGIQFTLTGAKESPFKRIISIQQLVAGVKLSVEIESVGRSKEPRQMKGIVSLLK